MQILLKTKIEKKFWGVLEEFIAAEKHEFQIPPIILARILTKIRKMESKNNIKLIKSNKNIIHLCRHIKIKKLNNAFSILEIL